MGLKFRRGTNAQKSGSLAFGEPYVNTDLNTLMVGGLTGDITLATSIAAGAYATTGSNTFTGNQTITGSLAVSGDLTLGGNITIGDQTTDTVTVTANLSSSLIPSNDNSFDVGSTSKRYRNIYAQSISASVLSYLTGSINKIAYFTAENKLQEVGIFRVLNTGSSIGIGTAQTYDTINPERFVVEAANGSYNIASFNTNLQNSYAQVNIRNVGSGSNASTDLVLWNDVSSETSSYIDLGLNSSRYSAGGVGYGGDGYLINAANDIYVGSISSGSNGHIHLFGGNQWQSSSISIYNDGTVGINTDKLNNSASTIPTPGFAMEISGGVKFDNSIEVTGSVRATSFVGSIGATNGVVSGSSQIVSILSSLNTYTGSNDTTNTAQNNRLTNLESTTASLSQRVAANEAISGTFARTNSTNVFTGNQTITGSLYVSQDLVVAGSSSIQNISSSNLVIGAAYVTLNTNSPSSRYAGLLIIDSGSAGSSGSILYDAVDDELLFIHKGNGTNVTSSHFLCGPETYDNVGNEIYLTKNRVLKGGGYEHLADSNINDDGTTISLNATTVITGSLRVSAGINGTINAFNGVVSGSSQIVGSSITTNTITIGSTSTALGGTSTSLAGLTSVSSTGFTGALTGNASTATTLQTARLINGTSFNGSADITIPNLVSGSSQISHDSTTGFVANKHIDHTAVSITAGSGLTGGGDISATRTLSIATGGVTNAMLANSTISGIALGSNLGTLTISTGLSGTSYNGSTGVTIANTGVLSITTNTGLSTNASATGNVTITNTGVTSNVAGTGVTVSGATGAVTISIGQAVATTDNVRFNSLGIGMAASATAGRIDAANDIVAYSSSDIRFKQNITPIENALDKISKISGNTYDWKEENKVEHGYEGNDVGVIAQEIEAVLPQLVQTRENGYKAVKYDKLVALLIEGIKEQQTQIHSLTIEIEKLKESKGL